jgi:hypothetical protein
LDRVSNVKIVALERIANVQKKCPTIAGFKYIWFIKFLFSLWANHFYLDTIFTIWQKQR